MSFHQEFPQIDTKKLYNYFNAFYILPSPSMLPLLLATLSFFYPLYMARFHIRHVVLHIYDNYIMSTPTPSSTQWKIMMKMSKLSTVVVQQATVYFVWFVKVRMSAIDKKIFWIKKLMQLKQYGTIMTTHKEVGVGDFVLLDKIDLENFMKNLHLRWVIPTQKVYYSPWAWIKRDGTPIFNHNILTQIA